MEYTIRGHNRSICQDFERTFWILAGSGYVREPTPDRPGTLAPQVCRGLAHSGGPLWAREDNFGAIIQRERARDRRNQARENERCGCTQKWRDEMTALTILEKTEQAVADPALWCKGAAYRVKDRRVQRCATGWINHYGRKNAYERRAAECALTAAVWSLYDESSLSIMRVNDSLDGRARILRALARAQSDLKGTAWQAQRIANL